MQESVQAPASKGPVQTRGQYAGDRGVQSLLEVPTDAELRFSTGMSELDRVLGGGLVEGGDFAGR